MQRMCYKYIYMVAVCYKYFILIYLFVIIDFFKELKYTLVKLVVFVTYVIYK